MTALHRRRRKLPHRRLNIYAAGDVIGFPALASTSMNKVGRRCHAFGFQYKQRRFHAANGHLHDSRNLCCGETEDSCKEKKIDFCVGRAHYENNARGTSPAIRAAC